MSLFKRYITPILSWYRYHCVAAATMASSKRRKVRLLTELVEVILATLRSPRQVSKRLKMTM